MAQVNKRLGGVETLLMTTSDDCASISSSIVRQVAAFGGDNFADGAGGHGAADSGGALPKK